MAAKQINLFKKESLSYGGDLQTKRKGRAYARPLSTKHTMHLTLRSTKATGKMSFLRYKKEIQALLKKFAHKNNIQLVSSANVGNHLHLQIKLSRRDNYKPFIRAITAAIAMKVSGRNKWTVQKMKASEMDPSSSTSVNGGTSVVSRATPNGGTSVVSKATPNGGASVISKASANSGTSGMHPHKFWDRRPFTRIVIGHQAVLRLKDYIRLNQFEGMGYPRSVAKIIVGEMNWFEGSG
jgi:REP element-mobilizing transposase RayT